MTRYSNLLGWIAALALAFLLAGPAAAGTYSCRGETAVGPGAMIMDLVVDDQGKVTFGSLAYQARVGTSPPMLIVGYPVDDRRRANLDRPSSIQFLIWATMVPRPTARAAQLRVNVNNAVLSKPWTKFSEELAALDAGKPMPLPGGFIDWLALPDSAIDYFVKVPQANIALVAVGDDQSLIVSAQFTVPTVAQLKPAAQASIDKAYAAARSPETLCKLKTDSGGPAS